MNNKSLGEKGEEFVSNYLISKGYTILDRNYKTLIGEIDIVAENSRTLCIVEVKAGTKESTQYFLPEQRVDIKKRNRLKRLAEIYMKQKNIDPEKEIRIDVISIIFLENDQKPKIEHFENI